MKALAAFPDEVAGAAEQLAPQRVVIYCMIWPPCSTATTGHMGDRR